MKRTWISPSGKIHCKRCPCFSHLKIVLLTVLTYITHRVAGEVSVPVPGPRKFDTKLPIAKPEINDAYDPERIMIPKGSQKLRQQIDSMYCTCVPIAAIRVSI
jgi:hypothetical protein